ncbi:MAG: ROK family protein [Sulfurimicrobium sp.]|nr:ROK family protein [Sulfurimicrobium sp.]
MRIGVDLGGSKIEIIALGGDGGVLLRERVATPQGDYMATVMAVAGLVEAAEQKVGRALCVPGLPLFPPAKRNSRQARPGQVTVASVGIGIPGAESLVSGLIKNANSTCLIGQPLRRDLQQLLQREVRIANDANCFALSEAADGAGAGAQVVFGVILGTGVGGGIVIDGRVLTGANAIAGEWGHNPMPGEWNSHPPSPLPVEGGDGCSPHSGSGSFENVALGRPGGDVRPTCYCGRKGCIELYLSGPGLAADHRRAVGKPVAESAATDLSAAEIAQRAADGDALCEATLQRYEARLARALAQVINILDPDVIVLGGGLSNMDRLYENVPRLWAAHVFSDRVATKLLKHRHGDSSGVRGAAWLWP